MADPWQELEERRRELQKEARKVLLLAVTAIACAVIAVVIDIIS